MAVADSESRTRVFRASLLAIAVCGVIPVASQRAPLPKPDSSFVVERGRAGVFEIGMTVDETQAIAGLENTKLIATYGEGMFGSELEIRLPGFARGPAITASISDYPCYVPAIRGLEIHDPRFKTSHGIGVGSTLADIRKDFPSARIGNFGVDGGPGLSTEAGVRFSFWNAIASRDRERVTAIWVQGGPNVRARRCPHDADWAEVFQEVLNAVVIPHFPESDKDRPPLVVIAETTYMCDATPLKPQEHVGCLERARISAPFLTGELARDFFGRNSGQAPVPLLDGASAVVAASEVERLLSPGSAQLPSTLRRFIVTFSSPGFDNGRAAVYVGYSCGSLCGAGSIVLLELRDEKWKVASVKQLWVS
jgi:hypothetical protein